MRARQREFWILLLSLIKLALRTVIRVVAFAVAYNLSAFHALHLSNFLASVDKVWGPALIFAAIGLIYDLVFRTNRTPWRFASVHELLVVVRSSTITILILLIAIFLIDRGASLPRSTVFLTWTFDIVLMTAVLFVRRVIYEKAFLAAFAPFLTRPQSRASRTPLLMFGDLKAADAFMRDLARDPSPPHQPVGLITSQKEDVGRELRGIRITGSSDKAAEALQKFMTTPGELAVLFLDDSIAPADIDAEQLGRIRTRGVRLLRRARTIELNDGVGKASLREINLEELLSRPPVELDLAEVRQLVSGRRILVTGAGGSIGSEICRQVAALGCAHIGLLDQSEFGLFNIDMEIERRFPTLSRSDILCDVRNAERVTAWMSREEPDIVFHAAALKHVPLMENHPCESVLTNVLGTWNVAEAARINGVRQMVFISTDKAVDPGNVMGATKRLAESVMRVHRAAASQTRFSVVRFGNVLGSAGSVVPTFMAQIKRGGPVTVTHPDIERYFMTIPEAVQLVLHATAASAKWGQDRSGVFVLDMGKPVKIIDLAHRLIELNNKIPGQTMEIQITGLRPGEKLTEALVDSTEEARLCDPGVFEVTDRITGAQIDRTAVKKLENLARSGDSDTTRQLIFEMLEAVRMGQDPVARLRG
jgi:O-antigen biosynthesis protein WbqV